MHNSCKRSFPFNRFKMNLQSVIEKVGKDITRMQHDCETQGHDLGVAKALQSNEEAGFRPLSWHLSDTRKLLKADTAAGKHQQLKPRKDLWETETVWKVFIHSAHEEKVKLVFQMEKKQFRAPPPATPADPLPHVPMTFGANPQKKKGKGKGKLRKTLTQTLSNWFRHTQCQ
jgi:hypothetical protein